MREKTLMKAFLRYWKLKEYCVMIKKVNKSVSVCDSPAAVHADTPS